MREMKDSGVEWIGEIPEDWSISRVKQLFFEVNERCSNSEDYALLSVSEYYGVAPRAEKINDDELLTHAVTLDGYKTCFAGDIVVNIMLAWKRALGVSQYVGIVSPAYCVYRSRINLNPWYYHYLFRTDQYAELFKQHSTGIIDSRLRMYPDKFFALKCQVPPIEAQNHIVTYLDAKCAQIDTIIARQQEIIEKLKAYKLSVITEAVTKGLNPDVPMKDSGVEWIGEIPASWSTKPFGKCTSLIQTGPFGSQLHAEDYTDDGIILVNPANIKDYRIVPDSKCSLTPAKANELPQHLLVKGDIVFARRGEMGRCALITDNEGLYFCGTGCMKICTDLNMTPEYTIYFMQLPLVKQYLELHSVGTTMANLNAGIISNIPTVCPPLEIQHGIVEYLTYQTLQLDSIIERKQTIITKLTEYKKSLIYEVVTGKKEV